MKLRIGDAEYDYLLALRKVPISALLALQSQGGPNRRQIQAAWDLIDTALRAQGQAETELEQAAADRHADDVMDSPEVLTGMAGTIFLAKHHAGEPIGWADAQSYSWPDEVNFIIEPTDLPEPENPPEASGEATQPDAETSNDSSSNERTSGTDTRKTSKQTSTATSS